MGWGAEPENGFRGQSSGHQSGQRYGGQGEYGGWGSGEGQGEYGGQGSWAQGQFSGQGSGGPGYGWQGYENQGYSNQDFNRQGIGWQNRQSGGHEEFDEGRGWQQGQSGPRFQDQGQFGNWRGRDQFGDPDYGYGQMSRRASEGFGGQGGYGGSGSWGQGRGGWEQHSGDQGSWDPRQLSRQRMSSQRFGGQGYGSPDYGQDFGGQGFGSQGQGRIGATGFSSAGSWMPGPYSGRGPQGYRRSDSRIEEDVCEALTHHGMLDASGIQVMVADGEVTLTGTVESRQAKRMAEDILDSVSGVKDVNNQLRVQGQSQMSQMGLGQSEEMNRLGNAGQGQHQGETQGQSRTSTKNQRGETAKAGSPR
jgi:hypothetical protein